MKQRTHYSYCIFYLDNKYYKDINKDLKDRGYHHIRAIIPTVRFIKKKSSRGADVYQEEPILFSYGFIKLPTNIVYNRVFLNRMKNTIPGIRGWLRDNESLHHKRGKKRRVENAEDFDDFSKVAIVPRKIVRYFVKLAKINSHLDYDDIVSLHPLFLLRIFQNSAGIFHLFDFDQAFDSLLDGLEVGQCSTQPSLVDIERTGTQSFFQNDRLSLTFRSDKQNFSALFRDVLHGRIRNIQLFDRFVQIDNVNISLGCVNIRFHLRIPLAGLMSVMSTRLQ